MANLNWTTKTNDVDDVVAEDFNNLVSSIETELDKKVDKVTGKGLSTNDYTDADKAEVAKVKDKVGFADYATENEAGVVKMTAVNASGLYVDNNGFILNSPADEELINLRASSRAITPRNLDYAVRSVRPETWGVGTTEQELSLSGEVNTIYVVGGIKDSLSITLPTIGQYGDFMQVDFYSGETPTTLTITSSQGITDIDLIPASNTTYSLFFDWGILYYDTSASSNVKGWRFGYAEYPHKEV